ncbi:hypothetical protein D3C72_151090 [compost metagenome]
MQAVMLSNGLRLTDEDPIFSLVSLVELALNEANESHSEKLILSIQALQRFRDEMRIIGDAVKSTAETLTVGGQFLKGENEQVLEEISAIRESMTTIGQYVSNKSLQENDQLNKVIEAINASLEKIINSKGDSRSALQARNETFLICQIKEITEAVKQVKEFEKLLESAAKDHIEDLIRPVLQQMTEQVKMLSNKDTAVLSLIKKTNDTQNKLAANLGLACLSVGSLLVLTFAAGYLLRPVLGS